MRRFTFIKQLCQEVSSAQLVFCPGISTSFTPLQFSLCRILWNLSVHLPRPYLRVKGASTLVRACSGDACSISFDKVALILPEEDIGNTSHFLKLYSQLLKCYIELGNSHTNTTATFAHHWLSLAKLNILLMCSAQVIIWEGQVQEHLVCLSEWLQGEVSAQLNQNGQTAFQKVPAFPRHWRGWAGLLCDSVTWVFIYVYRILFDGLKTLPKWMS